MGIPAVTDDYRNNGYVIVRGALPRAWVEAYRAMIGAWFDDLDRRVLAGEQNRSLNIFKVQSGINLGPSLDTDARTPYGARDFIEKLRESGLWDAGFFEEPLGALIEACSIRRQKPQEPERALSYHQDSAVVGGEEGMVFWIPLDALDAATPGLEIIPRWRRRLRHSVNPANGYLEAIDAITGGEAPISVTPLEPGDVLIFSLLTPHRTLLTPGMTRTRFSIDLRVVPLSHIPSAYHGWVVWPFGPRPRPAG